MTRRFLLSCWSLACLVVISLVGVASCLAQDAYPTRPIRLLIGYAAGGATDVVGRLLTSKLDSILGQPVIIENRVGAAGMIAAVEAKRAEPDGYTLLLIAAAHTFYPLLTSKPAYDAIADFTPISLVGIAPNVFAVSPALPVRSLAEFITLLKANPGKYAHGSSGPGSTSHFSSELFKQLAGVDMVHVPYRGSAVSLQDVVKGVIALHMDTYSTALELHRKGSVRILAVASDQRDADAPDIPTATEAGLPGMISNTYYALLGPPNLPRPIVDKLVAAVSQIRRDEWFQNRMKQLLIATSDATPAETVRFMKAEMDRWRPVIEKAGLKAD